MSSLIGKLSKFGEEICVVERGARENRREWLTEEVNKKIKVRKEINKKFGI